MSSAEIREKAWPINGKCVPFFVGKGTVKCRACLKELSEGLLGADGHPYCSACVERCSVCKELSVMMTADGLPLCERHAQNVEVCPRCGRKYGNDCSGVFDGGCQFCYDKPEGGY